jgi:hypothetical protein
MLLELACLHNLIPCPVLADGTGSYILKNIGSSESELKKARKAKYSVALQYLVLEEISN